MRSVVWHGENSTNIYYCVSVWVYFHIISRVCFIPLHDRLGMVAKSSQVIINDFDVFFLKLARNNILAGPYD